MPVSSRKLDFESEDCPIGAAVSGMLLRGDTSSPSSEDGLRVGIAVGITVSDRVLAEKRWVTQSPPVRTSLPGDPSADRPCRRSQWRWSRPSLRSLALRPIRKLVDEALLELSAAFSKLYAREGRPSIPPEQLLRALLLQAFYTVRSERTLMEQLEYNLLFRWFVGLSMDDVVWDATAFCKNRDRLLDGDIARKFHDQRPEPAAGPRPALERTLLGRRYVDRGLGQHEELFSPRMIMPHRHREVEQAVADATPSATFMARN
jgi:hypothetical protein